jgi:UDP-glucose 4-epimerase
MTPTIAIVTGAAGFVGSHVVERLLADGWLVRALDHPNANFDTNLGSVAGNAGLSLHRHDLVGMDPMETVFNGVGLIVHCASLIAPGPSLQRPLDYFDINLMGLVRVLEGARAHGRPRVVNISSAAVYGNGGGIFAETDHGLPENPYALCKKFGDDVCEHWARVFDVPAMSLRIDHPYGPRANGVVAHFVNLRRRGEPITLHGDGSQLRDFTHIRDIVEAIMLAAAKGTPGGCYNVCSGTTVTIRELAELIGGEIVFIPQPVANVPKLSADNRKIRTELGWRPTISLAQGISEMLA